MKLTIGSIYLGKEQPDIAKLSDAQGLVQQIPLSEISSLDIEGFSPYLSQIDEVVVGFFDQPDMDFLQFLPNVTKVWIISPMVKDINGLRHLSNLRSLAIDRPTCRMDVLGELGSLDDLYIDDWRPGAKSIFRLKGLVKVGIQKFGCSSLQDMSDWMALKELWINAGRLEDLRGIPVTIKKLRLSNLRKLQSLLPLSTCSQLEDLRLESCRKVNSLKGIEQCYELRILSVSKGGAIGSLEPLRNLKGIEQVLLAGGTEVGDVGIDALYNLPKLRRIIIPERSGLEKDRVLEVAPNCDIRIVK